MGGSVNKSHVAEIVAYAYVSEFVCVCVNVVASDSVIEVVSY